MKLRIINDKKGITLDLGRASVDYLKGASYWSSHHTTSNSISSALSEGHLFFWLSCDEALIVLQGSHQWLPYLDF